MRAPVEAVLLIASWEQLRLRPYVDAVGVQTWGWGHARRDGEEIPGEITREAANRLFLADLRRFESGVSDLLGVRTVAPHQFGALVSFAFNVGLGAFEGSTLLRLLREGDDKGAADQFGRWVKGTVGGKKVVLPGLVERRASEARLFRGEG